MKKQFESISDPKFSQMDFERMKRLKGGYTLSTLTCYSSGSNSVDGSASDDGVTGD